MKFSDTTNKQGLVQDIDYLVSSTDESFPIADKTRLINEGMKEVASIIFQNQKNFE